MRSMPSTDHDSRIGSTRLENVGNVLERRARSEYAPAALAERRSRSSGAVTRTRLASSTTIRRGTRHRPVVGRFRSPFRVGASIGSSAGMRKRERTRGRSPRRRMEDRRLEPRRSLGRILDRRRPRSENWENRRCVQIAPAVRVVDAEDDRRDRNGFVAGAARPGTGGGRVRDRARLKVPIRARRIPRRRPAGEEALQVVVDQPLSSGGGAVVTAGQDGSRHEYAVGQEEQQSPHPPTSPSLETDASHDTPAGEPDARWNWNDPRRSSRKRVSSRARNPRPSSYPVTYTSPPTGGKDHGPRFQFGPAWMKHLGVFSCTTGCGALQLSLAVCLRASIRRFGVPT